MMAERRRCGHSACSQYYIDTGDTTCLEEHRPLSGIAADVVRHWPNVYFGAKPYLKAMFELDSIEDSYYYDDARSIVRYFLSNARTWRGPDARRIKAELRGML